MSLLVDATYLRQVLKEIEGHAVSLQKELTSSTDDHNDAIYQMGRASVFADKIRDAAFAIQRRIEIDINNQAAKS